MAEEPSLTGKGSTPGEGGPSRELTFPLLPPSEEERREFHRTRGGMLAFSGLSLGITAILLLGHLRGLRSPESDPWLVAGLAVGIGFATAGLLAYGRMRRGIPRTMRILGAQVQFLGDSGAIWSKSARRAGFWLLLLDRRARPDSDEREYLAPLGLGPPARLTEAGFQAVLSLAREEALGYREEFPPFGPRARGAPRETRTIRLFRWVDRPPEGSRDLEEFSRRSRNTALRFQGFSGLLCAVGVAALAGAWFRRTPHPGGCGTSGTACLPLPGLGTDPLLTAGAVLVAAGAILGLAATVWHRRWRGRARRLKAIP